MRFSDEYLTIDWIHAQQLFGIGKYSDDSYEIFSQGKWSTTKPSDYKLRSYCDWLAKCYYN
ncbi:MAG: Methyl-CpG-binding domain protein 4 [Marteilia pararefringens]